MIGLEPPVPIVSTFWSPGHGTRAFMIFSSQYMHLFCIHKKLIKADIWDEYISKYNWNNMWSEKYFVCNKELACPRKQSSIFLVISLQQQWSLTLKLSVYFYCIVIPAGSLWVYVLLVSVVSLYVLQCRASNIILW